MVSSVTENARPSERVVEQRLRNRVMEALEPLAKGADGVHEVGVAEYVEQFFDVISDDRPWDWRTWSCFTPAEVDGLDEVHRLLVAACDATPGVNAPNDFIASGWPDQIKPTAAAVLNFMKSRGRFSEDVEETEPSQPG
jgi:hypothetical protein